MKIGIVKIGENWGQVLNLCENCRATKETKGDRLLLAL